MNGLRNILKWCRSYVTLTFVGVLAFVVYLTFFTDNSIIKGMEYDREISRLKEEIKQNSDTLRYYEELNRSLSTDKEEMERIVREHYHMQHPGEDVYIFE